MGARWYGQFTYADTAQVNPVPDPAAANPFAYADPTGHRVIDLRCPELPGQSSIRMMPGRKLL